MRVSATAATAKGAALPGASRAIDESQPTDVAEPLDRSEGPVLLQDAVPPTSIEQEVRVSSPRA